VAQIAAIAGEWLRIDAANGIEIVEGADHELVTRLESGRIDLALTLVRGGETFAPMIVATEAYVLALAPGHKLAGEAVIEPDALGADPMVIRLRCEELGAVRRHFTRRGIRPPLAYRTFNDERAMALVASGLGVTVMPESYANPAIATARLGGFDQTRTLGVLTSPLSMARTRDVASMRAIIAASYARSQ
jgi:DNA-binding transcriptional LysR family regulator